MKRLFKKNNDIILIKLTSLLISLFYFIGCFFKRYFSLPLLLLFIFLLICILGSLKDIKKIDLNILYPKEEKIRRFKQLCKKLSISIVLFIILLMFSLVLTLNYYVIFKQYINTIVFGLFDYPYICIVSIAIYFVVKNILLIYSLKMEKDDVYTHEILKIKKILLLSFGYYMLILFVQCIYFLLLKNVLIIKFFLLSIVIYLLIMAGFIMYQYREQGYSSKRKNLKGIFLVCSIILFICYYIFTADYWFLQSYISTIPQVYDQQKNISENSDGSYDIIMNDQEFKILQLTDIHLGGTLYTYGEDKNALKAVYDLISYVKPDFIIVTGDFVFSVGLFSLSLNNYTPIQQFCSFMRNIGVPWTFVYGNHDTESISTASFQKIDALFKKYTYSNTRSLLYSEQRPNISGRYNQYIKILNKDHSINQVLFLLDSNQYLGSMTDYDYIHDDQVKWYENTLLSLKKDGNIPNSMIFCHMPIEEYQDAYQLYKQNNKQVKYYFGEIREKNETISVSKYDSQLFETAKKLGSTKAIFVGHDHYNNISLAYEGIRLTYGRSIDYLAMPGINRESSQRGGTIITLQENGQFVIESIKLDDIR